MTVHDHCYEEEIEGLIDLFNSQNDQNRKIVEMLIRQKYRD